MVVVPTVKMLMVASLRAATSVILCAGYLQHSSAGL